MGCSIPRGEDSTQCFAWSTVCAWCSVLLCVVVWFIPVVVCVARRGCTKTEGGGVEVQIVLCMARGAPVVWRCGMVRLGALRAEKLGSG